MQLAQLIHDWEGLALINQESKTHRLVVNVDMGSAWLKAKNEGNYDSDGDYWEQVPRLSHYLTTHSFYESQYKLVTRTLQLCGFDVELISWV